MIKGLVENGELDLQAKESQLLWEDTSIYTFQDEDEVVTVTPVSSPEFDSWNLVTIIDANGEIESYEETQLRHLANDDVKITKWANGVPKGERVYNPNAPQIQRGLGEVYKRLNDCWGGTWSTRLNRHSGSYSLPLSVLEHPSRVGVHCRTRTCRRSRWLVCRLCGTRNWQ